MKIASLTAPMLAAFGEGFQVGALSSVGILDRVEVENEAGWRIATVLFVSLETAKQLKQGDILTMKTGARWTIRRIAPLIDDMIEVELANR